MFELVTIARPYAKAAFTLAIEQNNVEHWEKMLTFSSEVVNSLSVLLNSPMSPDSLFSIVGELCENHTDEQAKNLIRIMAYNKRLRLLPSVLDQFINLRNIYNSMTRVEVTSTTALGEEHSAKIMTVMRARLQTNITLEHKIDKSILGGIIIRFGDSVIDRSLRNRLEYLASALRP
jgi:F-type H+-transporting ATPase subunit delta